MKRTLLPIALILIQYSNAVAAFHFESIHALPPISRGETIGISLSRRQQCPFGVVCGGGCTILGPCCDDVTGFSCRDAETCVVVSGQLGCCPVGTTCTSIKSCLDASDPVCISGTPSDNSFCCDNTAPFCTTLGTAQVCQATMSNSTASATETSSTVVTQSSAAPNNSTATTTTASSTIEPTVIAQNSTSVATQQLVATTVTLSFRPVLDTSSTSTTSTATLVLNNSSGTSATTVTTSTLITVTSDTSIISVIESASHSSMASPTTYSNVSADLGSTLQLKPTGATATLPPLFTGGSTRGSDINKFMLVIFSLSSSIFL